MSSELLEINLEPVEHVEPEIDFQTLNKTLSEENQALKAENAELKEEIIQLRRFSEALVVEAYLQ